MDHLSETKKRSEIGLLISVYCLNKETKDEKLICVGKI